MAITPTGAAEQARSPALRFVLRVATLRHDEGVTRVHLIAEGEGWTLVYGADSLRTGAPVVLTLGSVDVLARIGWCDGPRARLDTASGDMLAELGRGSLGSDLGLPCPNARLAEAA